MLPETVIRVNCLLSVNKSALFRVLAYSTLADEAEKDHHEEIDKIWTKKHCYRNLYPWKTRTELVEHLQENIVYNNGGLIAINKPYGVPVVKKQPGTKPSLKGGYGECPYSLEELVPNLKKCLGVDHLHLLRSAEKYCSGIALFASKKAVFSEVQNSILRAKPKRVRHMVYWGITKGYPVEPSVKERVGLKLVDTPDGGKQSVIVREFSKTQMMKRQVKPVQISYNTLAINKHLSTTLIEMATNSVKWDFLHCYASSKAISILGEQRYAARVKHVFGKPIVVSPHNASAYDCQPLSDSVCHQLHIPKGKKGLMCVPVMLHHRQLILPQYQKKDDLVITAPLPHHFLWTCKQLGLELLVDDDKENSENE